MLQDPTSSGFRTTSFFRKHTDFFNVPQHFGGSTLVVKHLIRDCSPVYTHKHISPLTVLSSNSKTSRGGQLMHIHTEKVGMNFASFLNMRVPHSQPNGS